MIDYAAEPDSHSQYTATSPARERLPPKYRLSVGLDPCTEISVCSWRSGHDYRYAQVQVSVLFIFLHEEEGKLRDAGCI